MEITKAQAIALYGGASSLARALGISRSAVHQWKDGPIPEAQKLKLIYVLKPEGLGV